jgi:hypothetical protein
MPKGTTARDAKRRKREVLEEEGYPVDAAFDSQEGLAISNIDRDVWMLYNMFTQGPSCLALEPPAAGGLADGQGREMFMARVNDCEERDVLGAI